MWRIDMESLKFKTPRSAPAVPPTCLRFLRASAANLWQLCWTSEKYFAVNRTVFHLDD